MRVLWLCAAFMISGCNEKSDGNLGSTDSSATNPQAAEEKFSDGPFGIKVGGSFAQVSNWDKLDKEGFFSSNSPPNPHPDFESVVVEAYSTSGVCTVRGVGRNNEGDGAGSAVQSQVEQLAKALETKYGPYQTVNICSGGDIACQSDFWMMNLGNGEIVWGKKWEKQSEAMKQAGVKSIYLVAQAADINTSYPVIEFETDKGEACTAARNKASVKAL
jgi:hypothetical protein